MFEMDPVNPMARLFYVWVLILNGRIDEVGEIVAGFSAEVRGTIPARIASVLAHAVTGNVDGVHAAVSPEVEGVATATDLFPRFLAQGYALAGIPDRALYWLEIAIGRGFVNYPFLAQYDPFFHSLRADPRFAPLAAAARDRWERFEL
jgi:non-specific serine/threonine protein kinase